MRQFPHEEILETAVRWADEAGIAALASVVTTWGSAPRLPGSQLAISREGAFLGSVSSGCVEGAVVAEALQVMETARPVLCRYGVSDSDAFSVGLACGGTIRILVEPLTKTPDRHPHALDISLLKQIIKSRIRNQPTCYAVNLRNWIRKIPDLSTADPLAEAARETLVASIAQETEIGGETWFLCPFNPPLRLMIVGAGHVAQPLSIMAALAGYDVLIIDPREAFATAARFPGMALSHEWPDAALGRRKPDARTAVVTLAHDPKIDDAAIVETLRSPALYLGCLGSRRTHAKRMERLRDLGFDEPALARIHAPVGLDIGGRTPAEIAIAIMAELTQCVHGRAESFRKPPSFGEAPPRDSGRAVGG